MRAVTPQEMRNLDNLAISVCGIASITLMENAGRAVAEAVKNIAKKSEKICVICGKGNNGGDGLVASRHFINSGFKVDTYILGKVSKLSFDTKFNLGFIKRVFEITSLPDLKLFIKKFDYALVVDAIFGTGFSGTSIQEPARSLISFLNTTPSKIISIDIPSGLNGLSGEICDVAIKSDITVTLGLPKKGFFINDGPRYTGRLIVKNIGFPRALLRVY